MSGWIRRLLGPRWQHPDAQVRQQATQRLDANKPKDRQHLEQLALDKDASVRHAALALLKDPYRLLALMHEKATPELRQRLAALLCRGDEGLELSERRGLIDTLDDPLLLATIAFEGDNQQLRLDALARLDDEAMLIRQACDNGIAAVRHAAAERVESDEGLAHLARYARRDRQVSRRARERLDQRREDAAQVEAAQHNRERLLESLEQLGRQAWEPLYAGRYRHLVRQWKALEDWPDNDQLQRYQNACLACRKTLTDHEAQAHSQQTARQQREEADRTRRTLLNALQESLENLRKSDRISAQDLHSLAAQKRLLADRWQDLSDRHPPEAELQRHYNAILEEHERIAQAWERQERQAPLLEQALGNDDMTAIHQTLEACAWPDTLPPTHLLERARRRVTGAGITPADTQALATHIDEELATLEQHLARGRFKLANRAHQYLRSQLDSAPQEIQQRYTPSFKRLGAQLAELRDWRGFVAAPKRDQLCKALEALSEDQSLSDAMLDHRHRQLVKEWKELDDAAANREKSQRFRAASDRIHERLKGWRESLDQQRELNQQAREALCEQLEALLASPDDSADPDALREIRNRAREQWRYHSPIPRQQAAAQGRRFRQIMHGLQALIDQRARQIAEAKRELLAQAQALETSSLDAGQRAEQAKTLQRRWRELGRAPKGEEQTLWHEFRRLCDRIFAGRDAQRENHAQLAKERLDAMQALIDRLDIWQPSAYQDHRILAEFQAEAETLEPLPAGRRTTGMRKRWTGILRARRDQLQQLAVGEEVSRWQALQELLQAHLEADQAALNGELPPEVSPISALQGDMRWAHEQRNDARRGLGDKDRAQLDAEVEDRLQRLRIHLAVLAGYRIPPEDEPLRLAVQVERINKGLGREHDFSQESLPSDGLPQELHRVLRELLATGPISTGLWEREAVELNAALHHLLAQSSHRS
ncbi:DUF349 domain-containing protein [Pistricoccus aurantiacus]|uniref:DUF349 domain-containing protein n=1 Tax=Pistricoccus aurantiacus TaxID=1883414 RepID=A0A5B8SMA1_9GAMM|nr:DUF349 domain-containing protein [Pistricoccus aurantiacus]QEA37866.1 DUF349 domain-containing protein [Pistricoccus aurantiacus]